MARDKFKIGDKVLVTHDGTELEGKITAVREPPFNAWKKRYYVVLQKEIVCFADEMKKITPEEDTGVDPAGVLRTP